MCGLEVAARVATTRLPYGNVLLALALALAGEVSAELLALGLGAVPGVLLVPLHVLGVGSAVLAALVGAAVRRHLLVPSTVLRVTPTAGVIIAEEGYTRRNKHFCQPLSPIFDL